MEELKNKLNILLAKTISCRDSYKYALSNVDNLSLKEYFETRLEERTKFVFELEIEIKTFSKSVNSNNTTANTTNEIWTNFNESSFLNNKEAVMLEAIKSEKMAVVDYNKILEMKNLPATTKILLEYQLNKIKLGLYNIDAIEDLH